MKNCLHLLVSIQQLPDAVHLLHTQTSHQERRGKTDSVVVEGQKEKARIHQEAPDSNVRENAADEAVAVDHNGAIPVDGEEGPGQRQSGDRNVDEARGGRMVPEVESGELEEVEDHHDFRDDVHVVRPEHNPDPMENIEPAIRQQRS